MIQVSPKALQNLEDSKRTKNSKSWSLSPTFENNAETIAESKEIVDEIATKKEDDDKSMMYQQLEQRYESLIKQHNNLMENIQQKHIMEKKDEDSTTKEVIKEANTINKSFIRQRITRRKITFEREKMDSPCQQISENLSKCYMANDPLLCKSLVQQLNNCIIKQVYK